jgi:hypothetical protein
MEGEKKKLQVPFTPEFIIPLHSISKPGQTVRIIHVSGLCHVTCMGPPLFLSLSDLYLLLELAVAAEARTAASSDTETRLRRRGCTGILPVLRVAGSTASAPWTCILRSETENHTTTPL